MLRQKNDSGSFAEWIVPEPEVPSPDTVTLEAAAEVLEAVLEAPHNNAALEGDDACRA